MSKIEMTVGTQKKNCIAVDSVKNFEIQPNFVFLAVGRNIASNFQTS
jgi:hypothetical protein